jgi:trans-aconitate methyltransferase
MSRIFGEVAALYDEIRPGYPAELVTALREYRGREFASVVDIGAGTGKATAALLALAAPITCVEPDPRMAALLEVKLPQVVVVNAAFEEWTPPAAGVDLIACATAWHWMDPASRNRRAFDALAPGGVLAVFHNRFEYADAAVSEAIDAALQAVDPTVEDRAVHWSLTDVSDSGLFADIEEREWHRFPVLTTQQYLQLMQTFSPFRRHSERDQRAALAGLTEALARFGGAITMDIRTVLTLARRS